MKWGIIGITVVALLGLGFFLFKEMTKPLPGEVFESQGRDHVPQEQWKQFAYNSNPPTSGPHDSTWAKPGVYENTQGEGFLVHSLEHGYVVISYNCQLGGSTVPVATDSATPQASSSAEASSSAVFTQLAGEGWKSAECTELKKQLSDLANDKRLWKLIVVPRPAQDAKVVASAWIRLQKFDSFNKDALVTFIDAHRNHGPEATME